MVDRIDIGMDDDTDGTETPSFFQSQRVISPAEYGSSFVNFYNTSLGLHTLEEETGIEVETPEVELATPTVRDTTTGGDDFQPNILEQTAFGTGDPMNEVVFGTGTGNFDSYSDYLMSGTDGKFSDRVPFVQNIMEPLAEGRFGDIKFGETASTEVEQKATAIGEGVKEAPSRLERLATGKLTQKDTNKLVKGALTAMGGLPGAIAGSFIGGRPVKNAFGKNSYRPNGAMGMVADVVHSIQYGDMARHRSALSVYQSDAFENGLTGQAAIDYVNSKDVGFAMRIGNRGLTRSPTDGTYTGNMSGLSHEHVKALEAISKGYDPRGYNMSDPTKSRSRIEEDGGSFVSGNPMEGFYRANGTFYSPSANISSAYGTVANRNALAAKNGITPAQADDALSAARSGEKTLAEAIRDIRNVSQPQETSADSGTYDSQEVQDTQIKQQTAYEEAAGDPYESGADSGTQGDSGGSWDGCYDPSDWSGGAWASGGRVGYAPGGAVAQGGSGFVDRPPEQVSEAQSVADNQPDAVPEGTFIINSPAVEFAGSDDIRKMLVDAHKEAIRRGITVDNDGKGAKLIDVALSSGEVKVAPHLAKIIGYDRLEKINNRGKREVKQRIQENGQEGVGVATGGFINRAEGGDVGEDIPMTLADIPPESLKKFKKFGTRKRQRGEIKKFVRGLSDEEAMALLLLTETSSSVDPLESMEAIGEVAVNRAESRYRDFKNVNTIQDVMLQHTNNNPKKAFQFSGLEPTILYNRLTEVRKGLADKGLRKTFAAAQNVLSQEPDRASTKKLPANTLFYTKPNAKSQWMRTAKDLEFSTEIGGHEFYRTFASPEFP